MRGSNGKPKWAPFSSTRHLIGRPQSKWRIREITLRSMDTKVRTSTRSPIHCWQTALLELTARLLHRREQSADRDDLSQNFVRIRGFSTKNRLTRDRTGTEHRSKASLSPQSEMNNFRRRIHSQRKPITDAV